MSGLEHYDEELYALDQRIARLALACGADLARQDVVIGLIKGHWDLCAQAQHVPARTREELRALLMLKYRIEVSCVDALGADDCRRLIATQEERLARRGLPPTHPPDG